MRYTVDSLIDELQRQKAAGLPGDTVVALPSRDNNGAYGVANLDLTVRPAAVSKPEFEKGWTLAKFVSRGGVPVLVVG